MKIAVESLLKNTKVRDNSSEYDKQRYQAYSI